MILRAQWEKLLGSINKVIVVVTQEMDTLGAKICYLSPGFFSFQGEVKALFVVFFYNVSGTHM